MLNSSHNRAKSPPPYTGALCCLLALAGASGCSTLRVEGGVPAPVLQQAREGNFVEARLHAGSFDLTTFARLPPHSAELHVYIEGDGQAYSTRYSLSEDPTPEDPIALKLALRDPAAAVLWIARPCQYLNREALQACPSRYWSTGRYAEEVVTAIDAVIEVVAREVGARNIGLVGYSGGGTIAALVSARRKDVAWLVTVGANLDHALWTRLHGLTPLSGSLNPIDFAATLRSVPQRHYLGERDQIVPQTVINSYLDKLGRPTNAKLEVIADFDHHCCWPERWPQLLRQTEF
jgi:hypothetical protein